MFSRFTNEILKTVCILYIYTWTISFRRDRIMDLKGLNDDNLNVETSEKFKERCQLLSSFIQQLQATDQSVVLITSGGTTVPLESRTVRFIDNFSSGTRGSSSAEYFLEAGYAVIFLHRHKTHRPFDRHFSSISLLDMLDNDSGKVRVKHEYEAKVLEKLAEKTKFVESGKLHLCQFTSIHDYLTLLKTCCSYLKPLGRRAVLYLAAAVSDFYIPAEDLPEHKIQSADGPINLQLQLVPKMLKPLVMDWVPEAYVISFKLETDMNILIPKARKALDNYNHRLVIGNILETRAQVNFHPIFVFVKSYLESCSRYGV